MTESEILELFEITSAHSKSLQRLHSEITNLSRRLKAAELLIDVLLSDSQTPQNAILKIEAEMEKSSFHLLASEASVEEIGEFRSLLKIRIEALRSLQQKK